MSEVSVTILNQSIRVTNKNDQIIIRRVETNTLQTINAGGGSGSGDVVGPAGATNDHLVLFSGTTGKLIKDIGISPIALQSVRRNAANNGWEAFTPASALGFTPSRRLHYLTNVTQSFTGATDERLLGTIIVPGNTLQANDIVLIKFVGTKTGTAGTITWRIRVHTSSGAIGSAFSSGTIVGTSGAQGATNQYSKMYREIVFKNSLSSQAVISNAVANLVIDESFQTAAGAQVTLTNDYAVDEHFIITAQLAAGADTSNLTSWFVEIIRA